MTGGIGAGKSEALAAFGRLGAATISADAVVHELLDDPQIQERLRQRWGDEVVSDGSPDRARIAGIVFEQPQELAWLESELHPQVGERMAAWSAALAPGLLGVVEVPLLFETAMEKAFDAVVCVVAPDEVRLERAGERGQAGLAERERRQLSQEEKAARADYVIDNRGTLEQLEEEVAALLPKLTSK